MMEQPGLSGRSDAPPSCKEETRCHGQRGDGALLMKVGRSRAYPVGSHHTSVLCPMHLLRDVWSVEVSSHQGRGVSSHIQLYTPLLRCLLPAVDMPRVAENSKSGLGATVVVLCCCALYLSEDSVLGTTETPTALVIHLMTSAEVLQFTIKINSNSSLTCSSAIKIAVRTTIFYR